VSPEAVARRYRSEAEHLQSAVGVPAAHQQPATLVDVPPRAPLSHASRLWIEAELDQRQRLQKAFFPEGVSYDGKEFRTPLTCPFFNNFEGISWQADPMVARTGFEPVLPA
jgi:hypothetical protein